MDFMPYAQAYLERIFGAEGGPVSKRLRDYARGWGPTITEQFLVQDFTDLQAPASPALAAGYVRAHVRTLALSRMPHGLLIAVVHCPSLLRRDIAFEIGVVVNDEGFGSARLTFDEAHQSEVSLFLLGMGSLKMMQDALRNG